MLQQRYPFKQGSVLVGKCFETLSILLVTDIFQVRDFLEIRIKFLLVLVCLLQT